MDVTGNDAFSEVVRRRLLAGQRHWSSVVRSLVAETDPRLAACLEGAPDAAFLEPTLFATLHSPRPSFTLAQCLFGALDDERKPERPTVRSSSTGRVYLPGVGYFDARLPGAELELLWMGSPETSGFAVRGQPIEAAFTGIDRLAGGPIEVYRSLPSPFEGFFRDAGGLVVEVEVERITAASRTRLQAAFEILRRYAPAYFGDVLTAVRGVLVYDAPHPYSFATLGAHGVAFLNASTQRSTVFFLEDLVHQCAHVIFNAVTGEPDELFAVDPQRPLSEVSELDDYHGSLYGAFHGLFTQLNINRCLKTCHEAEVFSGHEAHELAGRISDDMQRFGTAVHALGDRRLYRDSGWWFYSYFRSAFIALYNEMRALVERFDTSNQPYVFSYDRFLERNPLPEPVGVPA